MKCVAEQRFSRGSYIFHLVLWYILLSQLFPHCSHHSFSVSSSPTHCFTHAPRSLSFWEMQCTQTESISIRKPPPAVWGKTLWEYLRVNTYFSWPSPVIFSCGRGLMWLNLAPGLAGYQLWLDVRLCFILLLVNTVFMPDGFRFYQPMWPTSRQS